MQQAEISRVRVALGVLLTAGLALAACTDDADDDAGFDDEFDVSDDLIDEFAEEFDDEEFDDLADEFLDDEGSDDEFGDEGFDGELDDLDDDGDPVLADEGDDVVAELEAAGFCDPADVESEGTVTAMHFVVDGDLRPACYTDAGGDDPRLLDAWSALTDVTPTSMYDDVSLLAGFESCDDCDTLAFVTTLDEAASFFLLAVAVDQGEADPDELRLTMLHELTHVFGQNPRTQIDVTIPVDECDTFHNGNGCYREGSYLLAWLEEFWPTDLADLPVDGSPLDDDESAALCAANADFTGSYAATHPEEDFAETFSAYVFDVEVDPALDEKLAFFDGFPEFVDIRERARDAGLSGLPASFEGCG